MLILVGVFGIKGTSIGNTQFTAAGFAISCMPLQILKSEKVYVIKDNDFRRLVS